MNKPPRRNLSPQADPWGAWAESELIHQSREIDRLGGDISNDGRLNNSSADLIAAQVQELYERSTITLNPGVLTSPAFSTNSVAATLNFDLPRPKTPRMAWVSVSAVPFQESTESTAMFITMNLDGRAFYRNSIGLPSGLNTPASWMNGSMVGYTAYRASPTSGGLITILLQASGYTGGASHTTSLVNIQATVNFGQKI